MSIVFPPELAPVLLALLLLLLLLLLPQALSATTPTATKQPAVAFLNKPNSPLRFQSSTRLGQGASVFRPPSAGNSQRVLDRSTLRPPQRLFLQFAMFRLRWRFVKGIPQRLRPYVAARSVPPFYPAAMTGTRRIRSRP
jgi:hypothetical protein